MTTEERVHWGEAISFDDLDEFFAANPERVIVLEWLVREALNYSNEKWKLGAGVVPDDHGADMRAEGFGRDGENAFWFRQIVQYLDRANLFGVGEDGSAVPDRGRQAALKGLMTYFDGCASMIREHGLPPEPGHTSGEVAEWSR